MVKGITRQVVVVKGPDPKLFEQAIFLVREEALADGGVTEEALLKEARMVCKEAKPAMAWLGRAFWSGVGAAAMGSLWLLMAIL